MKFSCSLADKLPQVQLVITRLRIFEMIEEYYKDPQEEIIQMLDKLLKEIKEEMASEANLKISSAINCLLYTVVSYNPPSIHIISTIKIISFFLSGLLQRPSP